MSGSRSLITIVLAALGLITLIKFSYQWARFLVFHLWHPSKPMHVYKRPGPEPTYALVTGASAGIGLGISQALVRQGFGVILLGHKPDELAAAAEGLEEIRPGVAVHVIVLDAQKATLSEIEDVVRSIADLQVSVLVNNVGGVPIKLPAIRTLDTLDVTEVDAVIDMNARFMARLTRLMLPILTRKPPLGKRSLIINLSSAGKFGIPWLVMYSATKAFNWAFSTALARELQAEPASTHVDCLALVPGDVKSQANHVGLSPFTPTWDTFGSMVVEKVDMAVRVQRRDFSPFWFHEFQSALLEQVMPEWLLASAIGQEFRRKRATYEETRKRL